MIESRDEVIKKLKKALIKDPRWTEILTSADALVRVHLAIFVEPYLTLISEGKKTIETRFSKNRIAPFESIDIGDIVLLKKSGGGIAGVCRVERVWFYNLEPGSLALIRDKFGPGICPANSAFWDERTGAAYCSLIWVNDFRAVDDIPFRKTDRRGWVILV